MNVIHGSPNTVTSPAWGDDRGRVKSFICVVHIYS